MERIELKIRTYMQQSGLSCLSAAALIVLNYTDPRKWDLSKRGEDFILKNIRFDKNHDFGCYPKMIRFLEEQGYSSVFLLGSVPSEKYSEDKEMYDIWMEHYDQIKLSNNVQIKNIEKKDLIKNIDDCLFNEKSPIIYYSNSLWHNLLIYGKKNDYEYLVFDPIKGRKIYNFKLLTKHMLSPWGVNAVYIKNGRKFGSD